MNKVQQEKLISLLEKQKTKEVVTDTFSSYLMYQTWVNICICNDVVFRSKFLKLNPEDTDEGYTLLQEYFDIPKEFFLMCEMYYTKLTTNHCKLQFLMTVMESLQAIESPEEFRWDKLILFTLIYQAIDHSIIDGNTAFITLIEKGPTYLLVNHIYPYISENYSVEKSLNISETYQLLYRLNVSGEKNSALFKSFKLMNMLFDK